jgi:hypothetical protein
MGAALNQVGTRFRRPFPSLLFSSLPFSSLPFPSLLCVISFLLMARIITKVGHLPRQARDKKEKEN